MSTSKKPNYRIYDRTGGGVTRDIRAESLDDAIAQGRKWIEDGDWSSAAGMGNPVEDGVCYQIGVALECSVREIVYVSDLSSIESLPGVYRIDIEDDVIIADIDREAVDAVAQTTGARLARVGEWDDQGFARHAVCLAAPLPEIEGDTICGDEHDCSGEYSDTLPDCEQAEHASTDDRPDDQGHVWETYLGTRGLGGTAMSHSHRCRLCGCYCDTHSAGSQRNPGEPRETVTIRDRDEENEAWLKETHEVDGWIPDWLAEMLDCPPTTKMTEAQAKEYVAEHTDEDEHDEDDLEHAFAAIFGCRADESDRADGLWSHLCSEVSA